MDVEDAAALIARAVPAPGGIWADLGAGEGTFTHALLRVTGRGSTIYAVDRSAAAITSLTEWSARVAPNVVPVLGDFTGELALPGLNGSRLDGILLANSLHFVADPDATLRRVARLLRPGGRAVFVEYDRRAASRWVPYPVSPDRLKELVVAAGFSAPAVVATTQSAYSGLIYVAYADLLDPRPGARRGE